MKPYISIHKDSVDILKEAGFKIYNGVIQKCDLTHQIILHIDWTGYDMDSAPHFHKLKYADGGNNQSSGGGNKLLTEIYFPHLEKNVTAEFLNEDPPDWMLAATMSVGLEQEDGDTIKLEDYNISHTTFGKRAATIYFSMRDDWTRFKTLSRYKTGEINPFVDGDI
jgi:hypothetical protein